MRSKVFQFVPNTVQGVIVSSQCHATLRLDLLTATSAQEEKKGFFLQRCKQALELLDPFPKFQKRLWTLFFRFGVF